MRPVSLINKDYFICLYNLQDEIVGVFDNYIQLKDFLGKSYNSIKSTVSRVKNGKTSQVRDSKGNWYNMYFIRK